MNLDQDVECLSTEIKACQKILTAIGDETRQHIILVMMQTKGCFGLRVNDIAENTNLSRPAVSHHLQILKKAGIIKMRREATKNYYYFDADMESFDHLIQMLNHAKDIMMKLPDRQTIMNKQSFSRKQS
ncbi:MAG: winged helix-turn-helix transcriptional regulator [Erysipelotrichaceae bacterium]|nr:winged helix-turn-helix transcriptional regulator [Erysipelotrichaceae bacterium]